MEYRIKIPCQKCKKFHLFFWDEIIKLCPLCWFEWKRYSAKLKAKEEVKNVC